MQQGERISKETGTKLWQGNVKNKKKKVKDNQSLKVKYNTKTTVQVCKQNKKHEKLKNLSSPSPKKSRDTIKQ